MAIYLLTRKNGVGYDEYDAKVIRASSAKNARNMANRSVGDEGQIWESKAVSCVRISEYGLPKEILGSFCAG